MNSLNSTEPRIHSVVENHEIGEPRNRARLSILQEYWPRPLSFQRILNNGGASEEVGKEEEKEEEEEDISRVLERDRRGSKRRAARRGPENAVPGRTQNVVDANAALSKRAFLFST